jgi:hypothetical protein
MFDFLRRIQLDQISFLAGFVAGSLFWWLARRLQPLIRIAWEKTRKSLQSARQSMQVTTEYRHRADTIRIVQSLHLASPLFSLDEIILPPRLLAPPAPIVPDEEPAYEDTVRLTIPYTPESPELATAYGAHTLGLAETLQGGTNLAIIGPPGGGKSTALYHLACQLANRDPEMGDLSDFIPFLVHAEEISLPFNLDEPLQTFVDAISANSPSVNPKRMSEFISATFAEGQAILLLDGLDELAPDPAREIVEYLGVLIQDYPKLRIVTTTGEHNMDGLPALGFSILPIAIWDRRQQAKYIQRWSSLWEDFIEPESFHREDRINPLLLNGWILSQKTAITPLEFTLKVWAAYAGDTRGATSVDALEAYIERMTIDINKARPALERLALQTSLSMRAAVKQRVTQDWTAEQESGGLDKYLDEPLDNEPDELEGIEKVSVHRVVPDLINNSLLIPRSDSRVSFIHPLIAGYLAGHGLARTGQGAAIFSQPDWCLKTISLHYLASLRDLSSHAHNLIAQTDDPLHKGMITVSRWLKDIPTDAEWRKPILQHLTTLIQKENLPLGLRVRILTSLATINDPGVLTLFRHLLKSDQSSVRQLGVLGCGFVRDLQSVKELSMFMGDLLPISRAACLALVNIGTKPALDTVAKALLQGSEDLRRAAAEAFSNHPEEGHPILEEGITVDDLLVRHSAIYGLRRVKESWAIEILENLQIEDAQWVVRNAAQQALEENMGFDAHIPRPILPLEDTPWLIAYASNLGLGISPGQPAVDMLLRSLREGSDEERLAALDYIRRKGTANVFPAIYHSLYGGGQEIREAAFNTLWHIAATGAEIPPPAQYGLGQY